MNRPMYTHEMFLLGEDAAANDGDAEGTHCRNSFGFCYLCLKVNIARRRIFGTVEDDMKGTTNMSPPLAQVIINHVNHDAGNAGRAEVLVREMLRTLGVTGYWSIWSARDEGL